MRGQHLSPLARRSVRRSPPVFTTGRVTNKIGKSESLSLPLVEADIYTKKNSGTGKSFDGKIVSFDLSRNVVHVNDTGLDKDDVRELWNQRDDFRSFRDCATEVARQVAKAERTNGDPHSYKRVLEGAHKMSCQPGSAYHSDFTNIASSSYEIERLADLFNDVPDRLGLEKLALRTLRGDKKIRKAEILDAVLDLQRYKDEESLCAVCEGISLPSRRIARFLAQALEASLVQQASLPRATLKEVTPKAA